MDEKVLDFMFYSSDLDREVSVRDYFKELLFALFEEGEGFSGKYPLGNSGWEFDLAECLIKNEVLKGEIEITKYGNSKVDFSYEDFDKVIKDVIGLL